MLPDGFPVNGHWLDLFLVVVRSELILAEQLPMKDAQHAAMLLGREWVYKALIPMMDLPPGQLLQEQVLRGLNLLEISLNIVESFLKK